SAENGDQPGDGRPFVDDHLCGLPRPTFDGGFGDAPPPATPVVVAKRGPNTSVSDVEIVEAIRAVLAATPSTAKATARCWRASRIAGSPSAPSGCCARCACIICWHRDD